MAEFSISIGSGLNLVAFTDSICPEGIFIGLETDEGRYLQDIATVEAVMKDGKWAGKFRADIWRSDLEPDEPVYTAKDLGLSDTAVKYLTAKQSGVLSEIPASEMVEVEEVSSFPVLKRVTYLKSRS